MAVKAVHGAPEVDATPPASLDLTFMPTGPTDLPLEATKYVRVVSLHGRPGVEGCSPHYTEFAAFDDPAWYGRPFWVTDD